MYRTLPEAGKWLAQRLGGVALIGEEVTEVQILRAGIAGHLLICVPLDTHCYSPSLKANADAFGLFVVPPRHLFALEAQPTVRLRMVSSLDGKQVFFPFEEVRRDMLRVHDGHLSDFADRIKLPPREKGGTERKLTAAQDAEIRKRLKQGESVASLAREFNVARRTIDKRKPPLGLTATPTTWPAAKTTRHRAR